MSLVTGTKLGRYEIRTQLGAGGMGKVYLAQDTKLDRKVALKILPADVADNKDRMRRFVQEAKAASALNHPNIITIYEIEQVDSIHFIATEFIDGETLRQRLLDAPMKLGEVLDVATQIASALSVAHAAGIVHRDIKPENIMLRQDGIVKVLDFGLAKLVERLPPDSVDAEAATKALLQTEPGVVMGTVTYMSPEQARGKAVDARTDIFSFGVVLYEMLMRRRPFTGETISHTIVAILEKEPAPLSQTGTHFPSDAERIIQKSLAKVPAGRYQTAQDLITDLKNLQTRILVEAEIASSTAPDREEAKTQIFKAHTTAGFETQNSIAVLPFANMSSDEENEYFCDGLAEELLNALAKIEALRVTARTSAFSFKGKETDVREIGRKLNVGVVLEGSVRKAGNRLRINAQLINVADGYHLWSERYDREMKDIFDVQDEISLAIVDALKVKLLGAEKAAVLKRYTENTDAYQLYLKGRYFWSRFPVPGYEKAREYFQQSIDLDPTFALGYCGLADYFGLAVNIGLMPPDEGWPKLEAAMNKALALDDALAEAYNPKAGMSLYYHRDWPAAERAFKRSIVLNPNFAEAHNHYAICLAFFGRTEEALREMRRALELDPLSLRMNPYQGLIFFWSGRYDEAIEQYRRTLELEANLASAHEWLGDAYEQKGQHAEAIAAWSRALVLQGNGELSTLLDCTFAASGFDAAVRALARTKLERLNERKQRGAYVPAMEFVTVYLRLGDQEQTAAWLARAVQERNGLVLLIQIDPRYESLRSDPQFAGLARQMSFTQ